MILARCAAVPAVRGATGGSILRLAGVGTALLLVRWGRAVVLLLGRVGALRGSAVLRLLLAVLGLSVGLVTACGRGAVAWLAAGRRRNRDVAVGLLGLAVRRGGRAVGGWGVLLAWGRLAVGGMLRRAMLGLASRGLVGWRAALIGRGRVRAGLRRRLV